MRFSRKIVPANESNKDKMVDSICRDFVYFKVWWKLLGVSVGRLNVAWCPVSKLLMREILWGRGHAPTDCPAR